MERYNLMGVGEGSGRIATAAAPVSPSHRDALKIPNPGQDDPLCMSILKFSLPHRTIHARQ